jgi:hypothetical protein
MHALVNFFALKPVLVAKRFFFSLHQLVDVSVTSSRFSKEVYIASVIHPFAEHADGCV